MKEETLLKTFEEMSRLFETFSRQAAEFAASLKADTTGGVAKAQPETPVEARETAGPSDDGELVIEFPTETRRPLESERKQTKALGTVIRINRLAEAMKLPLKTIKYAAKQSGITPFYPKEYAHTSLYVTNADARIISKFIHDNIL